MIQLYIYSEYLLVCIFCTSGMYNYLASWFQQSPKEGNPLPKTSGNLSSSCPMPETEFGELHSMDEKEIDQKFEEFLNDTNMNEDNKQCLRLYQQDKKKLLILQYRAATHEGKFETPEQYINCLENHSKSVTVNLTEIHNCVKSLRIALTSNTLSWVHEFGSKGLQAVLNILDLATKYNKDEKFEKIQSECLKCILKFTNNTEGIREFLHHDRGYEIVAKCINYRKPHVMISSLQILAALCFLNDSEEKIIEKTLSAITRLAEYRNCERFVPIVEGITMTGNEELWSTCLQFINALLSQIDDFEFRMHLRNEIVRNGLYDNLDILKNELTPSVKIQYHVFEKFKEEDADELHSRFDNFRMEIGDINDCFEALKNTTLDTPAEPYFLSILQHLLFIKDDHHIRSAYYKFIEECITQIVLHKSGLDPDFSKKNFHLHLQPLIDGLIEIENDNQSKQEELKKQLEEALAIAEGRHVGITGKLDQNCVDNVSKVFSGPPPPMSGMDGSPPPPMPEIVKDKHSKQEELKKQLQEALAAKEEALDKWAIAEGCTVDTTGKLDQNYVDNVFKVFSGPPPPPPPMPGLHEPLPPKMPGTGGSPPPPIPDDKTTEIEKVKQSMQEELKKQLQEAIAAKEEVLAKLAIAEERLVSVTGKLDQNSLDNVSKEFSGSLHSSMFGIYDIPSSPMPEMGLSLPPIPDTGGPQISPLRGMDSPSPSPIIYT